MDTPSKAEIKKFLEVVDDLSKFEAQSRFIRGYGAFREDELPVPECIRVTEWLKYMAEDGDEKVGFHSTRNDPTKDPDNQQG